MRESALWVRRAKLVQHALRRVTTSRRLAVHSLSRRAPASPRSRRPWRTLPRLQVPRRRERRALGAGSGTRSSRHRSSACSGSRSDNRRPSRGPGAFRSSTGTSSYWIGVSAVLTAVVYFGDARRGSMSGVNATAISVLRRALRARDGARVRGAARWRHVATSGRAPRMGPWGPPLRDARHLVPARGRSLHGVATFIPVPALEFGAGAIGFYAIPYTDITYPHVLVVMPRLWSVTRKVTATSRQRTSSAAASAAARPRPGDRGHRHPRDEMSYIGLQLVGIQAVLGAMVRRETCRSSSPSRSSRPTRTRAGCARRR